MIKITWKIHHNYIKAHWISLLHPMIMALIRYQAVLILTVINIITELKRHHKSKYLMSIMLYTERCTKNPSSVTTKNMGISWKSENWKRSLGHLDGILFSKHGSTPRKYLQFDFIKYICPQGTGRMGRKNYPTTLYRESETIPICRWCNHMRWKRIWCHTYKEDTPQNKELKPCKNW